jgi:hypothetical protein
MKKILLNSVIAAGLALASASAQSFNYNSGDALLVFKSSGGTSADQDIVINLGSLSSGFSSFTIDQSGNSSLLSSVYGSDWYTSGNVAFGLLASDDDTLKFTLASAIRPSVGIKGQYLNTINANVGQINAAALNGGSYRDVTDSLSRTLETAYFADTISGSVTIGDNGGWGYFGSPVVTGANPKYINTYTYTSFNGTDAPSELGTVSINEGVISVNAVPEPSTYALMGLGALLLVIVYRRKSA